MTNPTMEEIKQLHVKLFELRTEYWLQHSLFTPQWWFLLFMLIIPWVIWWFLVDKNHLKQIWLYGALMTILVLYLDDIGLNLHLWYYPYQLISLIPRLDAIDLGVLPVLHMLVYQFFRTWKAYLIVNTAMALFFALIVEPLFVKISIYDAINWKYFYSLPIYILKAAFVKYTLEKVITLKSGGKEDYF